MKTVFVWLCAVLLFGVLTVSASADTSTLSVVDDTTISSMYPPNVVPWGRKEYMFVGYASPGYGKLYSLVRFDLQDIPSEAVIESARLQAYYLGENLGESPQMDATIHRLTRFWDEESAAWSRMGNSWDSHVYDTQVLTRTAWIEWDATDLVRAWHTNVHPNYGFLIRGQERLSTHFKLFGTKEGDTENAARLLVEWAMPTPTATRTLTATPTPTPTCTPSAFLWLPLVMRQ